MLLFSETLPPTNPHRSSVSFCGIVSSSVSICLSIFLSHSLSLPPSLSVCLFPSLSLSPSPSLSLSLCPSLYLSICLSLSLSLSLSLPVSLGVSLQLCVCVLSQTLRISFLGTYPHPNPERSSVSFRGIEPFNLRRVEDTRGTAITLSAGLGLNPLSLQAPCV